MLVLILLLLAPLPSFSQTAATIAPDCIVTAGTTISTAVTNSRSNIFNNITKNCTTWYMMYSSSGFASVSIELDYANDSAGAPGSWTVWPAGNIPSGTLPLTSTSSGQITAFKYFPWVSIKLTTTGTGRLTYIAYGYKPQPGQDVNSAVPISGSVTIAGPNPLPVDGSGVTQPVSGTVTANQGTPTNWAVNVAQIGGIAPPDPTLPADVIQQFSASSTYAGTGCYKITTASTNATSCKTSAGNLLGFVAINTTATIGYIHLINSSANPPTCTDSHIFALPIPANTSGAGFTIPLPAPINFSTGIGFCVTGAGASGDNTNSVAGIYILGVVK